jgi:hypothetical protein
MQEVGPPDTRYSSGTAPYYQSQLDARHGRSLAGEMQEEGPSPANASSELEHYAEMDDVQGSGIFDAPGSVPNIHPDAGVFATRMSLPGYHAREIPFSETEIIDVTTGRPVRAVPSGAVAMDSAAEIAFIEQGAYNPPDPVLRAEDEFAVGTRSIANVYQNPQPIGATESTTWTGLKLAFAGAALGLAVGGIIAIAMPKKRRAS